MILTTLFTLLNFLLKLTRFNKETTDDGKQAINNINSTLTLSLDEINNETKTKT